MEAGAIRPTGPIRNIPRVRRVPRLTRFRPTLADRRGCASAGRGRHLPATAEGAEQKDTGSRQRDHGRSAIGAIGTAETAAAEIATSGSTTEHIAVIGNRVRVHRHGPRQRDGASTQDGRPQDGRGRRRAFVDRHQQRQGGRQDLGRTFQGFHCVNHAPFAANRVSNRRIARVRSDRTGA